MGKLIFVVDDEENIRLLIKKFLTKEGFDVEVFSSGEEVENRLKQGFPDMLILDIMMPGMDGYQLCRRIRGISSVPIIFVSAKDDDFDKVLGLELGSDDYLTKPFSPRELVARVKNIFRRLDKASVIRETLIKTGNTSIYPQCRKVVVEGKEINLTNKEFELLKALAINKNIALKREQLLDKIWGYDYYGDGRSVDDLVKRVRKKIGEAGSDVEIKTVWGYGYKLEERT
jgi:DNA-binding response OmpR family regulator